MNKKPTAKLIPLLATGITPAAAVTSALLSPLAVSAPGDLDPGFGDLGRLGPILNAPAWALQSLDNGTMLVAGGGYYYYYYYYPYATNFVRLLSADGSADPGFTADTLDDIQVFDAVRQPDGLVVGVGGKLITDPEGWQLAVFRLQSDGPLDPTFGTDGIFGLSVDEHGRRQLGTSVVLEPDGRIVVAGSRDDQVIVLRLLPNGSFDDLFGTSGVFAGPETFDFSADNSGPRTTILRTATGGYRVTASNPAGCQVIALTAAGALDDTFGTSGVATVDAPSGASTNCNSMVAQPDGRLLVAGHAAGQGFASRLLGAGQPDAGFSAPAVSNSLADATAVTVADDGSVVVAGNGVSGASIMRLQANGELDALFGNGGSTLIDLRSDFGASSVVHDMTVLADGSVVAVGGVGVFYPQAFIVKLLGTGGGASPGVLGVTEQSFIETKEGSGEIVVNVRRSGGSSGEVSLAYQALPRVGYTPGLAGQDFAEVAGRLTWTDGDTTEQQVRVPILSDNSTEGPEYFRLMLSDIQGGAALGTINATVRIAADGGPFGQFVFVANSYDTFEERVMVWVSVARNYYATGPVSVTVTPISGTATSGTDFVANPVTVSWADGDRATKTVRIPIFNDPTEEPGEFFTVELSNPTGGALIGSQPRATVHIQSSDQPGPSVGGGGALGYLSLLFLAVMTLLRSARIVRLTGDETGTSNPLQIRRLWDVARHYWR